MASKIKSALEVIKENLGVDASKLELVVCLYQQLFEDGRIRTRVKSSTKFTNNLAGFKKLVKWLSKKAALSQVHITIEPTGVYHENFLYYLNDHTDHLIHLIVASQTKRYAESLGTQTKTDKVDAKTLGLMGLERELKAWKPFSPNMRYIKQLSRERVHYLEQKTALSNRLHALNHGYGANKEEVKRLKKQLNQVQKLLVEVESSMYDFLQADPYLKERIDKVTIIKGLAWLTVLCVVAELNGFINFTSRGQVVSYCGYDVIERQSGSSIKGKTRISKRGNKYVRRALHFPALSAKQHEPKLKNLFERVHDRTGIKMKGAVAVQRKLLILIYTLFTKNEAFDREFEAKQAAEKQENLVLVAN